VKNVTVVSHPLVDHGMARLRDEATNPEDFRRVLDQVVSLLAFEATRDFEQKSVAVKTPVATTRARMLKREVLLVPILRAGLGMLGPVHRLMPHARVGMIGLKRDAETLAPEFYHSSLPDKLGAFEVIVLDPMLATGGSVMEALGQLYRRGAKRVRLLHLLAAPEGIRKVRSRFPDVPIVVGALDKKLNGHGYIVPGLGDAGDRIFGT
jgi:uracil phosphoribosyltransferase